MDEWKKFLSEHHDIINLSDDSVMIRNIGYDANKRWLHHVITQREDDFLVEEYYQDTGKKCNEWQEKTIRDYLGY